MDKLAVKLKDAGLAGQLIAAGFTNPRKIRDATNKELKAAVGSSSFGKVRSKFPKDT